MFKVLIIAYYFPPLGLSGVQRTLKFAKYLSKYNWEPTVITTGDVGYFAHDFSLLKEAENAQIKIIRTSGLHPNAVVNSYKKNKMPNELLRKVLNRISQTIFIPDNKIFWAKAAYIKARELLRKERFDIIFVSMPPFSPFKEAVKLKEEFGLPLVVDYRDLWFGNQFAFYPTPFHRIKHKGMEESLLRETDRVIVVNRKIKEKLLIQYPFLKFEDITIIPHGYDSEDFAVTSPEPRESDKVIFTYAGAFYEKLTPKYLLKALGILWKESPDVASQIRFQFIGHFRKQNLKYVRKYKLEDSVIIYDYVEHLEVIRKIVSSDVLWTMLLRERMENVTPGKLYEYFGARKPIFANIPNGAAKMDLEQYGAAFITPPDDVQMIKNTLKNIVILFNNNKLPSPNEEFVRKLDRKLLTGILAKEFQQFLRAEV
jgi:glycosyltransferase involved in cell wall biosynthesis